VLVEEVGEAGRVCLFQLAYLHRTASRAAGSPRAVPNPGHRSGRAPPRSPCRGGTRTSQVPAGPHLRACPALGPRQGGPCLAITLVARPALSSVFRTPSALATTCFEALSRGLHDPYVRFAAGDSSTATQDSVPAGGLPLPGELSARWSTKGFRVCLSPTSPSPVPRLRLAQAQQIRGGVPLAPPTNPPPFPSRTGYVTRQCFAFAIRHAVAS
jgi:hypothetical protein